MADGADAFVQAFTQLAQSKPQARGTIKRVIAEGDYVVLHVHRQDTPDDLGRAVVDIFRLDKDGKIIEHWDVGQAVPEKTASGRSMF
ncbi:nuclear transport factor 2 family protein [[Mannheimia] succiniciproducens]|uniref:nuclear transport factor 2 family protein n=1 Tax=[Mannheimia] succiniciproducens TaxID=157673 RepID=UPI00221E4397|nr:nuclear transport factor 2 family protein [[Mannheimia] succiniciproducens]